MAVSLSGTHLTGHPPLVVPTEPVWQLSVEQYHDMIRTGILTENDPSNCWMDGWCLKCPRTAPQYRDRSSAHHLGAGHPRGLVCELARTVTLPTSEPEPDVVAVRGEPQQYPDAPPGPQDVALLVEVADSTLHRDQTTKKRLYAQAGIPIYWIVNLVDQRIEVHREPSGPAEYPDYRQRQYFRSGDAVPLVIEAREVARVAAAELLP